VWLLGGISLLTDTASEAIYPLLPIFLTQTLGARAFALGLVEGVAEATASLVKVASGVLSDRSRTRRPWVRAGYGLSTLVRPLIGLAAAWPHVLVLRFADRVGKGVRGAPRDAMLAAVADDDARGRVFGFHRAMDHAGAVIGPLLATIFLWQAPGQYRTLFLLTIVPGLGVLALLWRLPADQPDRVPSVNRVPPVARGAPSADAAAATARGAWGGLPGRYYALLAVLLVFTLGNSSDAFLLLRLADLGVAPAAIPLLWALLHVVKATTSVAGGLAADRWGRRGVIVAGWLVYALVYAGFARAYAALPAVGLFMAYGLYFGLTEGAEKALVADFAPAALRGTAFGLYYGVLGVGALLASAVFGLLWERAGPHAAFALGSVLALVAAGCLLAVVPTGDRRTASSGGLV